jgi:hypothetical protein
VIDITSVKRVEVVGKLAGEVSGPGYEVVVALDGGGGLSVNGSVQGTVIAQRAGGGTAMAEGQVVL